MRFFRFLVPLIFLCTVSLAASAQSRPYVKKYSALADSLAREYDIPFAVIMGVAIIESSSGAGRNVKLLNNHFGMIGKNDLGHSKKGKKIHTRYKQYSSAEASYVDFCRLLTRRKFYKRLKGKKDYRLWIDAISRSNYSEAPIIWKQRVTAAIQKNKLSRIH